MSSIDGKPALGDGGPLLAPGISTTAASVVVNSKETLQPTPQFMHT